MPELAASPEALGVPSLDLGYQHRAVAGAVEAAFARILADSSFILGPDVAGFERDFAAYLGIPHVLGVGNGTDAVELALRGAGVGPGDQVLVPANTFVATAEGVLRAGAELRLVDCDDDFLIDVDAVAAACGPRTRAVVAVHLYGRIAPVWRVREAVGPNVLVIEDAAQSQGARTGGIAAGTLGDAAATSFYPGKNLGAYGDGGAVITARDDVAERVAALRNHGATRRYEHLAVGLNSRLDSLQAAVLSAKLVHLDAWNAERVALAQRYENLLRDEPRLRLPRRAPEGEHVYHQYVVQVDDRDRIVAEAHAAGVAVGIHYPAPIHRMPAYTGVDVGRAPLTRAENQASRILSLPIFPGMTSTQQDRVVDVVRGAL